MDRIDANASPIGLSRQFADSGLWSSLCASHDLRVVANSYIRYSMRPTRKRRSRDLFVGAEFGRALARMRSFSKLSSCTTIELATVTSSTPRRSWPAAAVPRRAARRPAARQASLPAGSIATLGPRRSLASRACSLGQDRRRFLRSFGMESWLSFASRDETAKSIAYRRSRA